MRILIVVQVLMALNITGQAMAEPQQIKFAGEMYLDEVAKEWEKLKPRIAVLKPRKPASPALTPDEEQLKEIGDLLQKSSRRTALENDKLLRLLVQRSQKDNNIKAATEFRASLLDSAMTAGGATFNNALVNEAIQILGQIVVDRALQEGWTLLRGRLLKLLQCECTAMFTQLCSVVEQSRIQNLVADPRPLLRAAAQDLLGWVMDRVERELKKKLGKKTGSKLTEFNEVLDPETLVKRIASGWERGGADGAMSAGMDHMANRLREVGKKLECPKKSASKPNAVLVAEQAMWAVAQCLIETPPPAMGAKSPGTLLAKCSPGKYLNKCTIPRNSEKPEIEADLKATRASLVDLVRLLFPTSRSAKGYRVAAKAMVQFGLQVVQDVATAKCGSDCSEEEKAAMKSLFTGFKVALLGLIDQQWQQVTSGSLTALAAASSLFNERTPVGVKKLFHLLVAVGQYAQTYDQISGAKTTEARRQILEELINAMVNRAEREGGWILSLGGSFGLGGGYRLGSDGEGGTGYGPFMLPIGLGLQSYPEDKESAHGWHFMLGILDIGQYVRFEEDSGEVKVGEVDAEDSVSISLHAGGWFGSRTVPILVAAHVGVSPFIRDDDVPVFYFGAMVGAYVPFLDFW